MRNMNILITAGPTRESIDPVRFISNRSSGKMGYALARAAARHGHAVVLVSGPVSLATPRGVRRVDVITAQSMLEAVRMHWDWCEVLIMAAAVADWRPRNPSPIKLKKARMAPRLELEPTPDILLALAPHKGARLTVGFAAETDHLATEARRKLKAKRLDLLVGNDVSRTDAGFEVDTNQVILLTADGRPVELPLMSKDEVAERILRRVEELWKDSRR